jgi:Cu2+-exporting ATPase
VAAASQAGVQALARLSEVREFAGQGLEGRLVAACAAGMAGATDMVRLGSLRFCGLDHASAGGLAGDDGEKQGMQVVLSDAAGWLASFEFDEVVRADAAQALAALQARGLEVHILSGDRQAAVVRVAERLGMRNLGQVQGDCTPQTKLELLRALQQQGRKVLMVGDGLNDGPVLAGAHVSMAVGSAVPLAQAQSDFVMPGVQLLMLPAMLAHARRTMAVVRQNLWWAASYNAVGVPLALAGWLPAWLAGLGMALSSLLVIANAARLATMKE